MTGSPGRTPTPTGPRLRPEMNGRSRTRLLDRRDPEEKGQEFYHVHSCYPRGSPRHSHRSCTGRFPRYFGLNTSTLPHVVLSHPRRELSGYLILLSFLPWDRGVTSGGETGLPPNRRRAGSSPSLLDRLK